MTTIAYIVTYLLARSEGKDDAQRIANGERIDHAAEWTERAGMVGIICASLYLISPWAGILDLLLSMLGCAMLFAPVHRFTLNKLRGLDWRYVSPSSWYDWQFLRLTHAGYDGERDEAIEWHGRRYSLLLVYSIDVHRAGLLAYAVEAILCIACWVLT